MKNVYHQSIKISDKDKYSFWQFIKNISKLNLFAPCTVKRISPFSQILVNVDFSVWDLILWKKLTYIFSISSTFLPKSLETPKSKWYSSKNVLVTLHCPQCNHEQLGLCFQSSTLRALLQEDCCVILQCMNLGHWNRCAIVICFMCVAMSIMYLAMDFLRSGKMGTQSTVLTVAQN